MSTKKIYTNKFRIEDQQRLMIGLSMLEKSALRDLEDHYLLCYPAKLPAENSRLYRMCGAKNKHEMAAVRYVIGMFFTLQDGKYNSESLNLRAETILSQSRKQSARASGNSAESPSKDNEAGTCDSTNPPENNDSQKAAVISTLNSYSPNGENKKEVGDIKSPTSKEMEDPPPKRIQKNYSEEFERFWQEFPQTPNADKHKSYKNYQKSLKIKELTHEHILESAKKYAQLCNLRGTTRDYVKRAHNWLESKLWECDYTAEIAYELTKPKQQQNQPNHQQYRPKLFSDYIGVGGEEEGTNGPDFEQMRAVN